MKSTAITENTSVYETDGRQNGPSVLRPQFAHQFSALVAHRPQKVEDRLPRAVVEIGFIKTAAHHLEKFGHRAQRKLSPIRDRPSRASKRPLIGQQH